MSGPAHPSPGLSPRPQAPRPSGRNRKEKSRGFLFLFSFSFQELRSPLDILTRMEKQAQGASRSWFLHTEGGLIWIRTQDSSVVYRWSSGFTQSSAPSTIFSAVKYPRHGRNAHPGPAFPEPWPVSGERVPRGTARGSRSQAWHNHASSGSPIRPGPSRA